MSLASYALPTAASRSGAEQWLVGTLAGWGLRPGLGRLWLTSALAAAATASGPSALVLEHDAAMQLVSLELRADGRVLFGVDDWVGPASL